MKIDMSQQLRGLDGKPVLVKDGEESVPMKLSNVCVNALLTATEGDKKQSGEDKFKNYHLAQKLHEKSEVELEAEEVAKLKERVSKVFPSPLVVGQAWDMLEGKTVIET